MLRRLLLALLLSAMVLPALAATTPNSAITVQTPRAYKAQLLNASGTGLVTVASGGVNGTKITGLWASSTDTASNTVFVSVLRGAVSFTQVAVTLPANSGSLAGSPPVNLLASVNWPGLPVDSDGNPYMILESNDSLQVSVQTAVTAGKAVNVNTVSGDF